MDIRLIRWDGCISLACVWIPPPPPCRISVSFFIHIGFPFTAYLSMNFACISFPPMCNTFNLQPSIGKILWRYRYSSIDHCFITIYVFSSRCAINLNYFPNMLAMVLNPYYQGRNVMLLSEVILQPVSKWDPWYQFRLRDYKLYG